ncbi:MAG: hypothetical protein NUW00_01250 [Candidatus Kaiserbacteria bacterium]|nr:hypothetical protein [Candidatus Kaiserbacteria bacterium]
MRTTRFFIFAVLATLSMSAVAQKTTYAKADDTAWEQVNNHSWVLHVESHSAQVVLTKVKRELHFTVSRPCAGTTYSEQYWWKYGESLAKGQTCEGKQARMETSYWRNWVLPLPDELRE